MSRKNSKIHQPVLPIGEIVDKINRSTSTIHELRVPFFLPIEKLTAKSKLLKDFEENKGIRKIKNQWGEVEIRGRTLLTQVHRDILDCIMTYKERAIDLNEMEVLILFSQTKILDRYRPTGKSKKNTKWLREKLYEIRDTVIKPISKNGISEDFNIIKSLVDASDKYGGYGIVLDKRYLDFFSKELTINYEPLLEKLLSVDNATIRSIIRWFFTQKKDCAYYLDTVLVAIGYEGATPRMLRDARRSIATHIDTFREFNIEYDPRKKKFIYAGNPGIRFIPSLLKREIAPDPAKKTSRTLPETGFILNAYIGKSIREEGGMIVTIAAVEKSAEGVRILCEEGVSFLFKNENRLEENSFAQAVAKTLDGMVTEIG